MTELSAPYRFVPLSRYILRPDWAAHVSHDHPFADGVCGEISLTLTAQTKLCVGGKQRAANKEQAGLVHFFRTPEETLAIPGSSLKGMLRSVMEIACFGHFQQVDDQKLGVRDISSGNNFYSQAMNRAPVNVGWLRFDAGEWKLTPCSYVRLHQETLIEYFKLNDFKWKKTNSPEARYTLLNGLRKITFNIQPYPYDCKEEAVDLGKGEYSGTVIITGQPGKPYDGGKGAKKREFVFYQERPEATNIVSPQVMQGFLHIYTESDEWKYWKSKLSQPADIFPGVPVFYHQQPDGSVTSLGLSRMYKLPYKNNLHEAIAHTQPAHTEADQPDLAGLIFGWLNEKNETQNLRGRVMPGVLTAKDAPALREEGPMVLSSPKPTYYPAYVHQPKTSGDYNTLMDHDAELSGWKRYPVREKAEIPRLTEKVSQNKKVQTYLEAVAQGATFTGKLRVHNLRLVELGALLWCLDFGNREQCRHALGMGKPLGFGQVSLSVTSSRLRHNNAAYASVESDILLNAARTAFEHYMDTAWQQATQNPDARWQESPQVVHLLAMADPTNARREMLDGYPEPKDFMKAKQAGERFTPYAGNQPSAEVKRQNALTAPEDETADLDSLLELAKERQAQQEQERAKKASLEQREQQKAAMSPEQKIVAEIEDRLAVEPSELTKTQIEKLAKDLLALEKTEYDWDSSEKENICVLGQRSGTLGDQLDKPKLQKAAKKVIKKFCPPD